LRRGRAIIITRLLDAARCDPRIIGALDYGSTSEGRGDAWSDIDVALFISDDDFVAFTRDWTAWAARCGSLLATYLYDNDPVHPWAIYDATPLPVRVDFSLHSASEIAEVPAWPNAPADEAAMVWYDASGGRLRAAVSRLVGQALGPADEAAAYVHVCGGFWYYALRTFARLQRGQLWAVRLDLSAMVIGNLLTLLRLEAGAVERWRVLNPAVDIERVITPERLTQLNNCIPSALDTDLSRALHAAVELAQLVCAVLAERYGRPWPEVIARSLLELLPQSA
jgi:hypothetical protein